MFDDFVYVIGLHAVQFVNNWMKKKSPRTAKLDEATCTVTTVFQF